jgi:hypothetical protein
MTLLFSFSQGIEVIQTQDTLIKQIPEVENVLENSAARNPLSILLPV